MHDQQDNKQDDPTKRNREEGMYVSLPRHPFYGQRVRGTKYEPGTTARYCLIEDPKNPVFHYQIKSTWLSAIAPLCLSPEQFQRKSVTLALAALDKMVQKILVQRPEWRREENEPFVQRTSNANLGADTDTPPPNVERTAFLPGSEAGRRHSS
jgi:hypothetical protein